MSGADDPKTGAEEHPASVADLVQTAAALQEAGMAMLMAEARAFASLMPGLAPSAPHPRPDSETEADFDNMPV